MILAVTLVCFCAGPPCPPPQPAESLCPGCTGIIALVLVFLYNIAPRHLMLLSILLLAAVVVEDAARGLVWLPVLAVVLLPINAERSTLSTYFDEMGQPDHGRGDCPAGAHGRPRQRRSLGQHPGLRLRGTMCSTATCTLFPAGMGIEFDMNTISPTRRRQSTPATPWSTMVPTPRPACWRTAGRRSSPPRT